MIRSHINLISILTPRFTTNCLKSSKSQLLPKSLYNSQSCLSMCNTPLSPKCHNPNSTLDAWIYPAATAEKYLVHIA